MSITITRLSPLDGEEHSMELPLTEAEFQFAMDCYQKGALIQNAFYLLNDEQREFIKTGITPEQWEATFGQED